MVAFVGAIGCVYAWMYIVAGGAVPSQVTEGTTREKRRAGVGVGGDGGGEWFVGLCGCVGGCVRIGGWGGCVYGSSGGVGGDWYGCFCVVGKRSGLWVGWIGWLCVRLWAYVWMC